MRNIVYILIAVCLGSFFNVKAQDRNTVTGVVHDSKTNLPVTDATIIAGARGSQTDSSGRFSIVAPPGTKIIVSHIGYLQATHVVKEGENNITIRIVEDEQSTSNEEVVTVGFTKRAKTLSTAATYIITADDIKDQPVSNLSDALQGKIPGVNIQNNNGMPGARGAIFQRGLSSLNVSGSGDQAFLESSQPLYVIDGVPIDVNNDYEYGFTQAGPQANPLNVIPAEDVESVEVLKDAAATVLYGSRGVNGVWIINTKKGKTEKPEVNYSGNVNVSLVPKLREVVGGRLERDIRLNQILNNNINNNPYAGARYANSLLFLSDSLNPYYNNSTDWQSYFYGPVVGQSHNLSFRGGSPAFNYKVNVGYTNQKGIIRNTGFKRYNINMNTTYQKNKFTMFAAINAANKTANNGSGAGLLQQGVASSGAASTLLPPPDIYNTDALAAFKLQNDDLIKTLMSNLDMNYKILPNLIFRTLGSIEYNSYNSNAFYPSFLNSRDYGIEVGSDPKSQYNSYNRITNKYYNRNQLSYSVSFNEEKHNFSTYIFNDLDIYLDKTSKLLLYGSPNDNIIGPYGYNLGQSVYGILGAPRNERIFGYGGNISYNYLQKYILSLDLRRDRTSVNGPMVGFSTNPAISGRWNFYKEKFVQDWNIFSNGAIRASWGKNIVPQGDIFTLYGRYLPQGTYMGQPTVGQSYETAPNAFFKPKSATTFNLGVDIAFKKIGLAITYEGYYRTIEDHLWSVDLPDEQGYNKFGTNDASMVNYGHELNMSMPILNKGFKWFASANAAYNKNILTRLPNNWGEQILYPSSDPAGLNVPIFYKVGINSLSNLLYISNGVYATDAEVPVDPNSGKKQRIGNNFLKAGDPRFADINGDYIIDARDLVPVGDPMPKVTGGFTNRFTYKNYSLTLNTVFTLFRDVINTPLAEKFRAYYEPDKLSRSFPSLDGYNVWMPGNTSGASYAYPYDYERNKLMDVYRYNQTLFMEDGSYFKILSATFSYQFDKAFLRRLKIRDMRAFVTGQNLYTYTKYSGPNPETVTDLGRDLRSSYPYPKIVSFGINATF